MTSPIQTHNPSVAVFRALVSVLYNIQHHCSSTVDVGKREGAIWR